MQKVVGEVFKIIREVKGLTLKEVADNIVSTAQLSRFERGISGITIDTFYLCLKNMNVPLDEFQWVYHNYTQTLDIQFSTKLSEAYLNQDVTKIKSILKDCLQFEEENPDQKLYRLKTIVVLAILFYCVPSEVVSNEDVQFLMDYLFSVEEWGRFELWIFTNAVGLMNVASLELFTNEMVKRTQFYRDIPENRKRILQMLLNVIEICIDRKQLKVAFRCFNYIDSFNIPETDLYERILIKFYRGFYEFQIGKDEAIKEMEKCANIMASLECLGTAQHMKEKIEKLSQK